jgi:hypothetical protein
MTKRIFLVFSRQDRELRDRLEDRLSMIPETVISIIRNEKSAVRAASDESFDFIVVGPSLGEDVGAGVSPSGSLQCCAELRRVRPKTAVVLLVPEYDQKLFDQWPELGLENRPTAIKISPDWLDHVLNAVLSIPTVTRRLDVIIDLGSSNDWEYHFRPVGFWFPPVSGRLHVDPGQWMFWHQAECKAGSGEWFERFSKIGRSIQMCFFEQNEMFATLLDSGMEEAGGPQHTRVTFRVDPDRYPLLLEAIRNPHFSTPWMIHTPIVRHTSPEGTDAEDILGSPFKPARILIVCADTEGDVVIEDPAAGASQDLVPVPATLPSLTRNIRKECVLLKRMLRREYARLGGRVEICLLGGKNSTASRRRFIDALKRRDWDVVHFAGHSKLVREKAYLFTEGDNKRPEAVPFSSISPWLHSTKVLYLSSCESSNADVAAEAAKAKVGAVLGFRWPVSDEDAEEHSRFFYEELLSLRSIDLAFWKARWNFYDRHQDSYFKQHDAWASSVLVIGTHSG